jgi:hypothetical protein
MIEQSIAIFLSNHGISPQGENHRSYIFDCPACGGKKKLYIEKAEGRTICFKGDSERCPKSGNPVYALSIISGLPTSMVSEAIYDVVPKIESGDNIPVSFDVEKVKESTAKPASGDDIPLDFITIYDPEAVEGAKYLESRGVTRQMMIKYGFLYSPMMRRVVFPVVMNNILYGWQGRAIDKVDKQYRMYNMPGNWKEHTLMFHNNIVGSGHAVLAEGPISALKFENVGGFVASMGKEVSKRQIELLRDTGVKDLYLALDRDAYDKVRSLVDLAVDPMRRSMRCFMVEIPSHRDDFGDCTYEECEVAFRSAQLITGDELIVHVESKTSIRTRL